MDYFLQKIINFIFNIELVMAQVVGEGLPSFAINNPIGAIGNDIGTMLATILSFIINIVFFIIAPAMYLWAGYQYLTSNGSPNKIASANKTLIWTTVGIVVILIARGIASIIQDFLINHLLTYFDVLMFYM